MEYGVLTTPWCMLDHLQTMTDTWVRLTSDQTGRGGKQRQLQGICVANHSSSKSENLLHFINYYMTAVTLLFVHYVHKQQCI